MDNVEYIKQFPLRTFSQGATLLSKDELITSVMAIREGFVKVSSISQDGDEHLLWIAGRYDFAPTEQLFAKHPKARYFYTALTDGSYYQVDRTDLIQKADQHPVIMAEIARGLSDHYDDFLMRVDSMDNLSVRERLMKTLLYIARRLSAGDTVNLYDMGLRITHQELAGMISSTRETTSLALNELRKAGFIDYDRTCFIVNTTAIAKEIE